MASTPRKERQRYPRLRNTNGGTDAAFSSGCLRSQLLRQRRRQKTLGISSYLYLPENDLFLFTVGGGEWFEVQFSSSSPPGTGRPVPLPIKGGLLNPQVCPGDSRLLAFVRESDIWLASLPDGSVHRITSAKEIGVFPLRQPRFCSSCVPPRPLGGPLRSPGVRPLLRRCCCSLRQPLVCHAGGV